MKNKTNPTLTDTIYLALKNPAWKPLAQRLSSSTRRYASVNLSFIDKSTKVGDTVVVPGKVLGTGDLTKKVRICALSFSSSAREKAKKSKSELITLSQEIKENPKANGIKVIQ